MNLDQLSVGANPPDEVNVVIEIPQDSPPVKYELDKKSGAMFVSRFLHTSMVYPANYGFIPHTLAEDGDPEDVLVIAEVPVESGAVVRCRPIGALLTEDQNGPDEKIVAVPVLELSKYYGSIEAYTDLPKILLDQIVH